MNHLKLFGGIHHFILNKNSCKWPQLAHNRTFLSPVSTYQTGVKTRQNRTLCDLGAIPSFIVLGWPRLHEDVVHSDWPPDVGLDGNRGTVPTE